MDSSYLHSGTWICLVHWKENGWGRHWTQSASRAGIWILLCALKGECRNNMAKTTWQKRHGKNNQQFLMPGDGEPSWLLGNSIPGGCDFFFTEKTRPVMYCNIGFFSSQKTLVKSPHQHWSKGGKQWTDCWARKLPLSDHEDFCRRKLHPLNSTYEGVKLNSVVHKMADTDFRFVWDVIVTAVLRFHRYELEPLGLYASTVGLVRIST